MEMRLLPQPLYRYEIKDEGAQIIDGAVFSFVWSAGTDPEMLLVIEARRTEKGTRWHYATMRFTNHEITDMYQDKEVWRADDATVRNLRRRRPTEPSRSERSPIRSSRSKRNETNEATVGREGEKGDTLRVDCELVPDPRVGLPSTFLPGNGLQLASTGRRLQLSRSGQPCGQAKGGAWSFRAGRFASGMKCNRVESSRQSGG
jgi:hypothetical protein